MHFYDHAFYAITGFIEPRSKVPRYSLENHLDIHSYSLTPSTVPYYPHNQPISSDYYLSPHYYRMQYQPPVRAESTLGLPQSMQHLPSSAFSSRVPSQVADFRSHENSYTTPSFSFPSTYTGISNPYSSLTAIFNENPFQFPDDSNQANLGMNHTPVSQSNYFQAATARHSTEVVAHNLSSNLPTYAQPSFTTCNVLPEPVSDYSMQTTTHDPVITIAGSNKNLNTCTFSDCLMTTNQPNTPPANASSKHRMETVQTMGSSAFQSISEHTHDFMNLRTRVVPDVIKPYIEYLRGRYQRSHFPT